MKKLDTDHLTIGVALNLNHHLLQTIDGLLATLARQLVVEVFARVASNVPGTISGLVWHICRRPLLQRVDSGMSSSTTIEARRSIVLLVMGSEPASITGVSCAARMSSLRGVTGNTAQILSVNRLLPIELAHGLVLEVFARQIRGIMPGVAIRRAVDLVKIVL